MTKVKKLLRWWRAFARGVRSRWMDYTTGTVTCFGGPLDGQREAAFIECYTVCADHTPWCAYDAWELGVMARALGPAWEPIGEYTRRGRHFVWVQYARNVSDAPNSHPPGMWREDEE